MTDRLLTKTDFYYPIYKVRANISYRKIGVPTVFAELLMNLAENSKFKHLSDYTLKHIVDSFQLDDIFITHTLEYLCDFEVLEYIFTNDLSKIKLADLKLTDVGKDFYQRKKMPGRKQNKVEFFSFHPLNKKYIKKSGIRNPNNGFALSTDLFPVQEDILNELSSVAVQELKWFTNDVTVEPNGINHNFDENNWESVQVKLTLDHNKNLALTSDNKLFQNWIDNATTDLLKENVLTPLLQQANAQIETDTVIEYKEDEILSLVLADIKSDFSKVKNNNAIAVKFSDKQEIPTNFPNIILNDEVNDAKLQDKQLIIPKSQIDISENTTQIFFTFDSDILFIESKGQIDCFFHHQNYKLPVKIVSKTNNNDFNSLVCFQNPNKDTLIFMSNFISEKELLNKLPKMKITEAYKFHNSIKDTWNKTFNPLEWIEKIELLTSDAEIIQFKKLFPKATLQLVHITTQLQSQLLDKFLHNPNVERQYFFEEFKEIIQLTKTIYKLNPLELDAKSVSQETCENIKQWKNIYNNFKIDFKEIADNSQELSKIDKRLDEWLNNVNNLFEPFNQENKYAVLDTNFVINDGNKIRDILEQRTIILPNIILQELDKLKQEKANAVKNAEKEKDVNFDKLNQKIEKNESFINKINQQLESFNKTDDELKKLSKKEKKKYNTERNQLNNSLKLNEDELSKYHAEKDILEDNIRKLEKESFDIREATRLIEELSLNENIENANESILKMIVSNNKVADDEILAIAVRYKLNDVVLCTNDKILQNKAKGLGININ